MSTRATYLFKATDFTPAVCFYIHYDGYISGAAEYFRAMLNHPNDRGGFPAKFLRANDLAEFTSGHDRHGDTEYQYTLEGTHLTVRHVPSERIAHEGDLYSFVNSYSEGEKFIQLKSHGAVEWLEESKAIAKVEQLRKQAMTYACTFGECGNAHFNFLAFYQAADSLAEALGADHPACVLVADQVKTMRDIQSAVQPLYHRLCRMNEAEMVEAAELAGIEVPAPQWARDSKLRTALSANHYRNEFGVEVAK